MRSWIGLVSLGCALAACGRSLVPADADHATHCSDLDQQITAALQGGSCNTIDDCVLIGGQTAAPQTCDCAPYVVDCGGAPVANNAPGLPMAKTLINQFIADDCPKLFTACDCGPRGPLDCVDHACTAAMQNCPAAVPDRVSSSL